MGFYGNIWLKPVNESELILEFNLNDTIKMIKQKLIKTFNNIIDFLRSKISKCKDSKFKSMIMKLLDRAKKAINKVDKIETKEESQELQQEAQDIKEEAELINEEITGIRKNQEGYYSKKESEKFTKTEKRSSKYTIFVTIKFNDKEFSHDLFNVFKNMESAESFDEYKKYRDEFRNKIDIPDKTTIYGISSSSFGINEIDFYYVNEGNSISKNPKYKLIPTWKSNDGRFYNTSRVYFAYVPINNGGIPIGKNTSKSLYTPITDYTKIYADTDLGNFRKVGACYIETEEPIKVKEINNDEN